MILLLVSFLAGVLTILAPCTLPLLPVMIGSSVARAQDAAQNEDDIKKRKRLAFFKAFRIASSLAASVILFTLLLKFSSALINIPAFTWTLISGSIIIIFGLISIFPTLWEKVPGVASLNTSSNKMLGVGYKKKGILGDIIIGASLGPVFSTCSPTYFIILATVLPQSFWLGFAYLIAYAIGLGGMIMLVSVLGQKLVDKLGGLSDAKGMFKKVLGVVFVLLGIAILTGVDKVVERNLLESGIFDITKVERSLLELNTMNVVKNISPEVCEGSDGNCINKTQLANQMAGGLNDVKNNPLSLAQSDLDINSSSTGSGGNTKTSGKIHKPSGLPIAPELTKPSGFINTDGKAIHIADYRGKKIILLDVWTYSCINCQRTLPYVNAWYDKYKDQGLEIIGLHTPEFAFEKVQRNVAREVKKFGITYPVVMDNEYGTWNAYGNSYWPRKYLINEYGEIIYDHIGEGSYEETEMQIQKALAELNSGKNIGTGAPLTSANIGAGNMTDPKNKIEVDSSKVKSPEVYFGFNRNSYLSNGKTGTPGEQTLSAPQSKDAASNALYLNGTWNFESEYASTNAESGQSKILFKYEAKNVYMVLSGKVGADGVTAPSQISVYVDGIKIKTITVKDQQLYNIVEGADYGIHTVELRVDTGELNAYTFTFG
ncbi:MAG: redoxin domain-containing protein [Candidatus Pacebacteria bacterium]|nr:redoxin domain-containing protein [Candidatus Paceibacterota bacterium]